MEKQNKRRESGQMFALIAHWEGSGESQRAFCAAHGVPLAVFIYWRRRYQLSLSNASEGFVEVSGPLGDEVGGEVVRLRLRDSRGVEVDFYEGVEAGFLRRLLSW